MAEAPGAAPGKGRVEAFSDGVIAILVTIMVLELRLPDAFARGLDPAALAAFAPKLIAYAMSFLVLAVMWVNHRHLLHAAREISGGMLWLNNFLLFGMSLVPAATGFLGEHPFLPNASAIYGAVLTCTAATFTLMRYQLLRGDQQNPALARTHARNIQWSAVGNLIYAASIPLAYVSVYAAFACFAVVPAMFFLPGPGRQAGGLGEPG